MAAQQPLIDAYIEDAEMPAGGPDAPRRDGLNKRENAHKSRFKKFCKELTSPATTRGSLGEFAVQAVFNYLSQTIVMRSKTSEDLLDSDRFLRIIVGHVCLLVIIIYTFSPVSGAHFNSAVTLAFTAVGIQSAASCVMYILAQTAGAIAGSYLVTLTVPGYQDISPPDLGAQFLPEGTSVWQAFITEVWGTFLMITVVFSLAVDPRGWGRLAPMGIALTVGVLLYVIGPISSCAINPSRALGPAVALSFWDNQWIFLVAPPIGAVLGALTWSTFFLERKEEQPEAPSFCPGKDGVERPYIEAVRRRRALASDCLPAKELQVDLWLRGPPPRLSGSGPRVLDFFDPDCAACESTIPRLARMASRYSGCGVQFVGITHAPQARVEEFITQTGLNYYVGLDSGTRTTSAYMEQLGFNGLPFVALVGTEGQVLWSGHPMEDALEGQVRTMAGHAGGG